MKKKVLFGLGALAFACVLTLNVKLAKSSNSVEALLSSSTAVASAEGPYDECIWIIVYNTSGGNIVVSCVAGGCYCCPISY